MTDRIAFVRRLASSPVITGSLLLGLWIAGLGWIFAPARNPELILLGLPLLALLLGLGHGLPAVARESLGIATPLGLFWALNHRALESWWMRDDPCHLTLILDHGIWRPFVHSIGFFLTPWLNLSLGLDFSLFGPQPAAFYIHQLLSFSLLLGVGYAFLRGTLTSAGAGLALSLFVASVPAFAVAQLLMNRHYLEGLILALAGFALYRRSVISRSLPLAIVGSLFYLLATSAKEVFVPLVLLLPFLAAGDRRTRWRHAIPYLLSAGFYGLWRLTMLGWRNSFSAYGSTAGELSPEVLLARLAQLLGLVQPWQALVVAAAVGAAALLYVRSSKMAAAGLAVTLAVLALPLLPVAGLLEPRHLFLGSFAVSILLAATLDKARLSPRPALHTASASAATLLLLLAFFGLSRSPFWQRLDASVEHHRQEGRFILEDPRHGVLLTTVNHSTFLECLARLRREVLGLPDGPGFCGDPCFCGETDPGEHPWRYSGGRITALPRVLEEVCSIRRPLTVHLAHDQAAGRISWQFGPYQAGTYEVLLVSAVDPPGVSIPVALPRQGSRPYWLFEPLRLAVRYRSPEGWQTYSPILTVEPDGIATAR